MTREDDRRIYKTHGGIVMAKVIVEIDGERHRLTKDRKLDYDCEECSLKDRCNRLEAICSIFKSESGSYHFVNEDE